MLSEAGGSAAAQKLDFTVRAQLTEWMDEPCTYDEFRACLRDLAVANRLTFAYRPTLRWLKRMVAGRDPGAPLRIVDVGCGGGDMLRSIADWGFRKGVPVHLVGIDLNPYAARAAAERTSPSMNIEWVTSDALSYTPPGGIDIVISSLFTHHLSEPMIVRFLAWMEANARLGWFINDLHRSATPYYLFRLLARLARWHPFVQHDGPVSIRRSFSPEDWRGYLARAGVDLSQVRIERFRPARLCVGRLR